MKFLAKNIVLFFFILIVVETKSQIIYTDINPDTTLFFGTNQNITFQFSIKNSIFTITTFNYYQYNQLMNLSKMVNVDWIEINSTYPNSVVGGCNYGYHYFQDTINVNDTIDNGLMWSTNYRVFLDDGSTTSNSLCFPPMNDFYLGLKIKDSIFYYYGWVRVKVAQNHESITIYDYAYNSQPNNFIVIETPNFMNENLIQNNIFKIFPNPAINTVTIESKEKNNTNGTIEIINIDGNLMYSSILNSPITELNIEKFQKGFYTIKLITGKNIEIKKLIKQ